MWEFIPLLARAEDFFRIVRRVARGSISYPALWLRGTYEGVVHSPSEDLRRGPWLLERAVRGGHPSLAVRLRPGSGDHSLLRHPLSPSAVLEFGGSTGVGWVGSAGSPASMVVLGGRGGSLRVGYHRVFGEALSSPFNLQAFRSRGGVRVHVSPRPPREVLSALNGLVARWFSPGVASLAVSVVPLGESSFSLEGSVGLSRYGSLPDGIAALSRALELASSVGHGGDLGWAVQRLLEEAEL